MLDDVTKDYHTLIHFTPTVKERNAFAKRGVAMPDGSFYIRNGSDLDNAIMAVGRATPTNNETETARRNAVRRHIIQRASQLGLSSKIPDTWNSNGSLKQSALVSDVETVLAHFGRKGMKWGEHVFGLHLQKQLDRHQRVASGKGSALDHLRVRGEMTPLDIARHKGSSKAFSKQRVEELTAMKERIKAGKPTLHDRLVIARNARATDTLRRAKHDGMSDEAVLEHFGRKGMKWGEHVFGDDRSSGSSNPSKSTAKADKNYVKNANKPRTRMVLHNAAADEMNNTHLPRINNKPVYKGKNLNADPALKKKYENEVRAAYLKSLQNAADRAGPNKSGTAKLQIQELNPQEFTPAGFKVTTKTIKHDDTLTVHISLKRDANGFITSMSVDPQELQQSALDVKTEEFISHFGRKGMKWGEHRFGRDRGTSSSSAHPDAVRAHEALNIARKHGTSALSTHELRNLNNRLQQERQFSQLTAAHKSEGRKFIEEYAKQTAKQELPKLALKYGPKGAAWIAKNVIGAGKHAK